MKTTRTNKSKKALYRIEVLDKEKASINCNVSGKMKIELAIRRRLDKNEHPETNKTLAVLFDELYGTGFFEKFHN